MGLGKRIGAAVAAVMNAYAWERTGRLLPPLSWSLDTGGLLVGCAGVDYADDGVAGVLIRWAEVLDLTPTSVTPACAGSAVFSGTVDDWPVLVWGVVDRGTWEADQ